MNNKSNHIIHIFENQPFKRWDLPAGYYRGIFESSERTQESVDILRFKITSHSACDNSEYWVRNRYREEDQWRLVKHLQSWLGNNEFLTKFEGNCFFLDSLYGREADIEVICIQKFADREPLRVIQSLRPPGTYLPYNVHDENKNN
jgi:hypothetical protein